MGDRRFSEESVACVDWKGSENVAEDPGCGLATTESYVGGITYLEARISGTANIKAIELTQEPKQKEVRAECNQVVGK